MLKRAFDGVIERRSSALLGQIGAWLPAAGSILDLGSGTGHLAARLERDTGLAVTTADVSDMHVTGPVPVVITDGTLPFEDDAFAASLLVFMLAYPADPVALLAEARRVTRGPVILVQTLYGNRLGYLWHRGREFVWTIVAFHVSRLIGYVPRDARFSMHTRRFYTDGALRGDIAAAGLHIRSRDDRRVLPARALVVAALRLERDA